MSFLSDASGEIKHIPWWAWAGGAVALLFFGSHLLNQQNSAAATSATDAASAGGIDSTGSVGDIGSPGPQLYNDTGLPPRSVNPGPQPVNGTGLPPTRVNGPTTGTSGTSSPTAAQTYTVRGGDTLYDIASRYHVDENTLYSVNAGTIEATAKSHALASSDHGHWIFPGEILKIPA